MAKLTWEGAPGPAARHAVVGGVRDVMVHELAHLHEEGGVGGVGGGRGSRHFVAEQPSGGQLALAVGAAAREVDAACKAWQ